MRAIKTTSLQKITLWIRFKLLSSFSFSLRMAVITKDAKIPDDAPQELLFDQHLEFLLKYGKDKDDYDYVMSEFLRINGVYWVLTAVEIMGKGSELDRDGVSVISSQMS